MCGVVAVLSGSREFNVKLIAERMLSAIAHRGPDENGVLEFPIQSGFAIGANRLSVIGRSNSNITPFRKGSGHIVLAYNGEIYNFADIRTTLKKFGVVFETDTDTEVFYEAWLRWGEQSLTMFNGMFAVAILDVKSYRLTLARDIAGQKPLYYYSSPQIFAIASEAKAFQTLPVPLELIESSEDDFYEAFQHNHKKTLYKNVYQVLPATVLSIDLRTGELSEREYWAPSFGSFNGSYEDAIEQLHELMTKAVKRHCNSEVKYGLYLSDGLDSNLINLLGHFQYTYTYNSTGDSEREIYEKLPEIVKSLDFPIASLSAYPLFKLANLASEDKCTVVLSGEGADELFGGYVRYLLPIAVDDLWQSKSNYRPLFSKAVPDPNGIFTRITCRNDHIGVVESLFEKIRSNTPDLLTAMQYFDFKYIMPSLLNMGDRMSSRFSLENRCPYLDSEVIAFAFSLPSSFKLSNGVQKKALHDLGSRLGFTVKPQKTGLTIDFNNYLHRKDWGRSSYFSILNYIWVSMFNNYKLGFSQ